ncbi:insulinase family protein [Nannocystaceae bacterium ST9]
MSARTPAIPEMAVGIHVLDNGLHVYLSENHEEPWISCRVAVRAGAAHEPADTTGLAHYLEHMLANKGTRRLGTRDAEAERPHFEALRGLYERLRELPPTPSPARDALLRDIDRHSLALGQFAIANELKQAYGLLGAQGLNAYTSHDRTIYTVDIPANRLAAWAMLEGDRFAQPVFRGFPTELETIIEEKNRALDDPGRLLSSAASTLVWKQHPYARDVLGQVEHLQTPSLIATEAFFRSWYRPNNMAIVLAGDFDSREALALIRRHFDALEPAELPPAPSLAADPIRGVERVEVRHQGDEEVRLIWRTVARDHADAEALLLADMMLDNSSTGLLDTRLEQTQKVRGAGAWSGLRMLGGTETVWGRPRVGQSLEQVEDLLMQQVVALGEGDFRHEDLDALIRNFEVGELRRLESNSARAALLLDVFTHGEDWEHARTRLQRLAAIQPEQICAAVDRWMGEDYVVARRHAGEPEVRKIPVLGLSQLPLDSSSHSALFREVVGLPAPELPVQVLRAGEHYQVESTPIGRLYRAANPINDLFQLTLRFEIGSAHDPVLAKAMALWARAGVGELDLEGFKRAMFHDAAGMSVDCRRQQTELTLAGRAEILPRALARIDERLRAPVLNDRERARWAEDVVGKRIQRRETANFKGEVLKQWALRGRESPYLVEALTNEQVLALGLDELAGKPRALAELARTSFYAGPHGLAELSDLLGLDRPPLAEGPAIQPVRYLAREGTTIHLLHHDAAQAQISLLAPAEPYTPAHSPEYRLFDEYVGGQAGLIFQEVREARGLAYAAHGGHTAGARLGDQNLVWASVGSRSDRAVETITLLLELLRELPAQAQRFERARSSAIEKLLGARVRFRGYAFSAETWRLRGLVEDPRPALLAALRERQLSDLLEFAAPIGRGGMALTIVGDTSQIDRGALGKLGEVVEHRLDDLVVY